MLDQLQLAQLAARQDAHPISAAAITDKATAQVARVEELLEQATATYTAVRPELTIVIPVYNEPDTVIEIVQRVHRLPITKQIIVVNDGSTHHWRVVRPSSSLGQRRDHRA